MLYLSPFFEFLQRCRFEFICTTAVYLLFGASVQNAQGECYPSCDPECSHTRQQTTHWQQRLTAKQSHQWLPVAASAARLPTAPLHLLHMTTPDGSTTNTLPPISRPQPWQLLSSVSSTRPDCSCTNSACTASWRHRWRLLHSQSAQQQLRQQQR